ncbi:Juvenile hormone esterase [Pseudolycoriella hygida]|uniref:Carboxylic ester hydrolase n=1 Tax=Pseudolycoriella hygida TaxID=35572 RepID=A0A9Q0MZ87_9DIPT|nr:Juvenile hormone esterase [Pseudolycoriella hygida]
MFDRTRTFSAPLALWLSALLFCILSEGNHAIAESFNVYDIYGGDNSSDVAHIRTKRATYNTFIAAHTMDPSATPGFPYTHNQWVSWFHRQEQKHTAAYRRDHGGRNPRPFLTKKNINTIVITPVRKIQNDFPPGVKSNGKYKWSKNTYRIITYKSDNGANPRFYDCPDNLYILVALDDDRQPMHLQGPPVPVKSWNKLFDATEDGPMCVQPSREAASLISEDCLRLNVYTRSVDTEKKRDVIIYLHPGGFYVSSGRSSVFGPEHLMEHDIVLVTINYRLGTLGFLATGTKDAPGNMGLKDQTVAMKWVQENIAVFGGNPDSVTLLGYSAGASSCSLHLVSPMSQGLFHRVIVMSSSAVGQFVVPSDQLNLARKQARLFNCSDESIDVMMECFRKATKEDYANTLSKMFEFLNFNPILLYYPVVEPDFGQERFLTDNPTCLLQAGKFPKVEILTGLTEYEFLGPAVFITKNATLRKEMENNFSKLAPICFSYERDTLRSEEISAKLRSYYFNDSSSDDWLTFDGLKDLFAEGVTGFRHQRFAELVRRHTKTFHYKFAYTGRYSYTNYPEDKPYGAVHHDELLYLFHVKSRTPLFNKTDPENQMIEKMTGWWTNFASSGDPNVGAYTSPVVWNPLSPEASAYLNINEYPELRYKLFADRYAFWNELFPVQC